MFYPQSTAKPAQPSVNHEILKQTIAEFRQKLKLKIDIKNNEGSIDV